jgi:glycosyltransferase involved in cell wall biosynthesis
MSSESRRRPLRVVHALAGAGFGGAENFYTRLVCALAGEPDMAQAAFTRPNDWRLGQLRAAGVPVHAFRFGGRLDLVDHLVYRRALRRHAPDVVLTYMNRASLLTPRGEYTLACRLGHYYDLKYYRHADYWVGNTRGICDYLVRGGMPAGRVEHIPNFADETPVEAVSRDSFDTPAGTPVLLSAGRLHVNKAFDILLRALVQVPGAWLWLAGEGPERQALEALCAELGLQERVQFLGWRNDVGALMRAADLFVCPSRHEGLGSIVLESWLHRCPIVATASQGPAELISDGETGLLTPIDDVARLAGAINSLLADPAMSARLVANARQCYDTHYAKRVIVARYAGFFRQIAGRGSQSGTQP